MAAQGNVSIIITKPQKVVFFYFFHSNFRDTKGTIMTDPILESSLKTRLNVLFILTFLLQNKKVDKFQLCIKTAASLFPFSCIWQLSCLLNCHARCHLGHCHSRFRQQKRTCEWPLSSNNVRIFITLFVCGILLPKEVSSIPLSLIMVPRFE